MALLSLSGDDWRIATAIIEEADRQRRAERRETLQLLAEMQGQKLIWVDAEPVFEEA